MKELLNQLGAKYTAVELDTESEFSHTHAHALDKMINTLEITLIFVLFYCLLNFFKRDRDSVLFIVKLHRLRKLRVFVEFIEAVLPFRIESSCP